MPQVHPREHAVALGTPLGYCADHAYSLTLRCVSLWAAVHSSRPWTARLLSENLQSPHASMRPAPILLANASAAAVRRASASLLPGSVETLQSPHARARPTPILVANASAAAVRRASASSLPGSGRKAPGGGAGTTTTLFTLPSASHLRGSPHHWLKPIAHTCHVGTYT